MHAAPDRAAGHARPCSNHTVAREERQSRGRSPASARRPGRPGHGVGERGLRAAAILAGGAAGALARAGLAEAFPAAAGDWPWGTFAANQLGALLLAWLATDLTEVVGPTRFRRPLLGTGFCGALTTFSAFQVETIEMARHDRPGLAATYAIASIGVGMACAVAGAMYARRRRNG